MVPVRRSQSILRSSRACMFHGEPPGAASRTSDLALDPVRAGIGRLRDASSAMSQEETTARAAIEVLYAQHHGEIYAYLLRMLREPELAADFTQDTFVKAYRAWDSLEDRAHARAWLYQIAHRVALDEIRRRKIIRFLPWTGESKGSAPSAEHLVMDVHLSGELQRALERIPERQRNALLLAELHDLTGLELAAALGVSHVAARALLTRARESLRQALAAERADERGAGNERREGAGNEHHQGAGNERREGAGNERREGAGGPGADADVRSDPRPIR